MYTSSTCTYSKGSKKDEENFPFAFLLQYQITQLLLLRYKYSYFNNNLEEIFFHPVWEEFYIEIWKPIVKR